MNIFFKKYWVPAIIICFFVAGLSLLASSSESRFGSTQFNPFTKKLDITSSGVNFVNMTVPNGFSVSGNPITASGTLALGFASGYSLPLTASTSNGNTAYGWGNHAGLYDPYGQATSTLSSHTSTYNHTNYDTAYSWGNHATQGYLLGSYASSTYQLKGSYITSAFATSTYQPIGSYITSAFATSTYQPLGSYLTSAYATSTYQPLGSYLTSAYATSTYVNKANASTTLLSTSGQSWFSGLLTAASATFSKVWIPYLATLFTNTAGEFGLDTTTGQLRANTGSATTTYPAYQFPAFTYATSSWSGTTTIPLGTAFQAETWSAVQCYTSTGTTSVSFYDGTNRMNLFLASTTANTITLSTNNNFTAGEKRYVDIGAPAGSPTYISCTVKKSIDPD